MNRRGFFAALFAAPIAAAAAIQANAAPSRGLLLNRELRGGPCFGPINEGSFVSAGADGKVRAAAAVDVPIGVVAPPVGVDRACFDRAISDINFTAEPWAENGDLVVRVRVDGCEEAAAKIRALLDEALGFRA